MSPPPNKSCSSHSASSKETTMTKINLLSYLRKRKGCFSFFVTVSVILYTFLYITQLQNAIIFPVRDFNTQVESCPTTTEEPPLACQIPTLDPFDVDILDAILEDPEQQILEQLDCKSIFPLLFDSSKDEFPPYIFPVLSREEYEDNYTISRCCYRAILRGKPGDPDSVPDHSFSLTEPCYNVSLETRTIVSQYHDFISIECYHQEPILNKKSERSTEPELVTIVDMFAFVPERQNFSSPPPPGPNVLVIGLDAMSRQNFIRRFPKSHIYLQKVLRSLDYEIYNKIGDNSLPNLGPLLTNHPVVGETNITCEVNKSYDACPFIWQHYERHGYRTLLAEDDRRLGIFDYLKRGFVNPEPPTTYYFRTFNSAADGYIGTHKLMFAKACYGPRLSFQVMLQYVQKVIYALTFRNEKYFQFTWSSSLTHDFLSAGVAADKILYQFLKWSYSKNFLNNTILLVMGDHGARWGPIRSFYQGQLEERLPALYMVLPPWFQDRWGRAYQNLVTNTQRLITVWDLYQTFYDLATAEATLENQTILERESQVSPETKGVSLFLPISRERTCEMAGIPDNYCTCNHRVVPGDPSDPEVQLAANFTVKFLKQELSKYKHCAELNLSRIISVGKVNFGKSKLWQGYQLNVETEPGGGRFEALVVHDEMSLAEKNWTMSGRVLRTNLYGNQSWCVDDKQAKLYCFCIE